MSFIKFNSIIRSFHKSSFINKKVSLLGAAGNVGQSLALLLKQNSLISHLSLYDIAHVKGVAADISHIPTIAKVSAHHGVDEIRDCLENAEIVVIASGLHRKPGMHREDLFDANAGLVAELIKHCSTICPNAMFCIITNPINSTVPIAAEILRHAGVYDPAKLFGITTLDVVRANTFVAQSKGLDSTQVNVTVVGGHSGVTIVPLLSMCVPSVTFPISERSELTNRIQHAGTEVVQMKAGAGTASLVMAYSANRFVRSLLAAINGTEGIIECSFVESNGYGCEFFAMPVLLGKNGVKSVISTGNLLDFEKRLLDAAIPELRAHIARGKTFAKKFL